MSATRRTLIAPVILPVIWQLLLWLLLLLKCHVVVTQETVDMATWRDESQNMASCECKAQRANSLGEKHLETIRSIIKDVREIYTDCSSQTNKVNSLKSQNKYLLKKVEHLEGDVTFLDKEMQVLQRIGQEMPRDSPRSTPSNLPGDCNGVTVGINGITEDASGECESIPQKSYVSKAPSTSIILQDFTFVTFLNETIDALQSKVTRLEKTNKSRRRKLRLLTKKNEQQGAALNRMERRLKSQASRSDVIYKKQRKEGREMEGKLKDLAKVVRGLQKTMEGLTDRQKGVNRKYRQVVHRITRLHQVPVDTT